MNHRYYGDSLKVELPNGSGRLATLDEVATEIARRLTRIFLRDDARGGRRPVFGDHPTFQTDPHWREHLLFYEFFHGEDGTGLGASHQTGWTALVAELIRECTMCRTQARTIPQRSPLEEGQRSDTDGSSSHREMVRKS